MLNNQTSCENSNQSINNNPVEEDDSVPEAELAAQVEELNLDDEYTVDATNDKKEWLDFDDIPTFSEVFWAVWKSLHYTLPSEGDQDKCFMFEYLSRDSRVST